MTPSGCSTLRVLRTTRPVLRDETVTHSDDSPPLLIFCSTRNKNK